MRGHILIVEDQPEWSGRMATLLEERGFQVSVASDQIEAEDLLENAIFHVAVVDISLKYKDHRDEAGMTILGSMKRKRLDRVIRTIVVSAYGTRERMRRAFVDYSVDDFIPKTGFSSREFVSTVESIFSEKVRLNPSLEILPDTLDVPVLFTNMEVGGIRVRRGSPAASELAVEFTDLLKRLFFNASSIVVLPMTQGRSGTGVLRIKPVYADSGIGAPVVVKFGDATLIEQEAANFRDHVEGFVGQGRTSSIRELRYTPSLAGIVYSFLGTDVEQLTSFESFYREHSVEDINNVLDDLVFVTSANWYANRKAIAPLDLLNAYLKYNNLDSLEQLEQFVYTGQLKRFAQHGDALQIHGLADGVAPQPFRLLRECNHMFFTSESVTHGDLHSMNLLVDGEGHSWLIDYYRTGTGHFLRDFVKLEASVKYGLLACDDFPQLLLLETALASAKSNEDLEDLSTQLTDVSASVQKAFSVVGHIRSLASRVAGPQASDHFNEYQLALAIESLNMARYLSIPIAQRLHALLGASVTLRELSEK